MLCFTQASTFSAVVSFHVSWSDPRLRQHFLQVNNSSTVLPLPEVLEEVAWQPKWSILHVRHHQ